MTDRGPDMADYATMMRRGTRQRRQRRFWRMLPGTPRCELCHGPLAGPLMPVFRLMGKTPWRNNPHYCRWCFRSIVKNRGGAEIETTLLFADVRGSTEIAERLSPQVFRQLMGRFFEVASDVLVSHEAIVDKFVGDEVVAIFIPALTGNHAAQAVDAGLGLLRATGHPDHPWLPIGVGVNTGIAYVGAMGSGENVEMTAMGDAVNVAARLGGSAGGGELLVSGATAAAAGIEQQPAERRRLTLRGKSEPTDVLVLRAGRPGPM
jgi:adenylate cyclase